MSVHDWANTILNGLGASDHLAKALSRGGDFGDLYYEESSSASLVLEDGRIEEMITGRDQGASLRVAYDHRQAFAATNTLTPARLAELGAELALAVDRGEPVVIPDIRPGVFGPAFDIPVPPAGVGTDRKVELLRRAESAARGVDPRVRQVRVMYADRMQKVAILRSDGLICGDERASILLTVQVVAAQGDLMQVGYHPIGGAAGFELLDGEAPEQAARQAAERAVALLEADEAPSGPMPVVLAAEAGGVMIHEAIGHGLEADLAEEGLSVFAGRIGEQVASPLVTVVDDATITHCRGSFAMDDEGTPAARNVLVENGVLKGYMHDRRSALKAGVRPTGNGRRQSFRHLPVVRMTNTMIVPGDTVPESILAETPDGLLVRRMGGGQVNTVNGDFVFQVSEGYRIENGKQGALVRGATLTGNGPQVLMQIDRVGSDLGFDIGTCGKDGQGVPVGDAQPTVRIPGIVVGGRSR